MPHDPPKIDAAFAGRQPLGSSSEDHRFRRRRLLPWGITDSTDSMS
jgi:hypothetical protein